MSKPKTRRVKYTGKETTTSLIGNGQQATWKPGDVKDVVESKLHNHVKYPYFEEVAAKVKSKSEERREKIQKEEKAEEAEAPKKESKKSKK